VLPPISAIGTAPRLQDDNRAVETNDLQDDWRTRPRNSTR